MRSKNLSVAMRALLISLLGASIAGAKVPYTFSVGQTVRSAEVNANFSYLDTSISLKTDRAALDSLTSALGSKSDTSVPSSIRKDLLATRSELDGVKTQLGTLKDDAWVLGRISDTANGLRSLIGGSATRTFAPSFAVQGPADFTNGSPWYGIGLSDIASGPNFLVQLGGYYGLRLQTGGGYPIRFHSAQHPIADFGYDASILYVEDKKSAVLDADGLTLLGNLNVGGSITAKAVSQVPDYVFEPGYKLSSLAEVEAFTTANRHLPDVPSASEIESKGVDLAKMNLVLLKKVEELTLHAIAQEKRLRSQESTIATQEDRLKALEGKLGSLNAP
ncbi:MAG: hypothetical protein IPK50_04805 [Fibrobacterota bacterium]|nr:hypothetical protein [Fibrobacterota bacterium]QQS06214.1 MAG: hypothetical protein IPK50_04805 [Fibrobacterota bacterium]